MTITAATAASESYAVGRYKLLLEDLGAETSRTRRASILDEMADTADELADATRGRAARDDARGDTLAWRETSTLLRQLATAERGATAVIAIPLDDDDTDDDGSDFTDWDAWARVAAAATADEYDEAVTALIEVLAAFPLPPFALRQLADAAMACAAGRPAAYPARALPARTTRPIATPHQAADGPRTSPPRTPGEPGLTTPVPPGPRPSDQERHRP